ncbi:MAG: hypothetical protein AB9828_06715 [Sphaerochaetaceae bacterium]
MKKISVVCLALFIVLGSLFANGTSEVKAKDDKSIKVGLCLTQLGDNWVYKSLCHGLLAARRSITSELITPNVEHPIWLLSCRIIQNQKNMI